MNQELKDGISKVNRAYNKAKSEGKWTDETKELAVLGAGMEDNATCGVNTILQMFCCKKQSDFKDTFKWTWKDYIEQEFQRNFVDAYKELRQ